MQQLALRGKFMGLMFPSCVCVLAAAQVGGSLIYTVVGGTSLMNIINNCTGANGAEMRC